MNTMPIWIQLTNKKIARQRWGKSLCLSFVLFCFVNKEPQAINFDATTDLQHLFNFIFGGLRLFVITIRKTSLAAFLRMDSRMVAVMLQHESQGMHGWKRGRKMSFF